MKTTLSLLILAVASIFIFYTFNTEKQQINNPISETVQKAHEVSTERDTEGDTFSIVAYDPATGEFGGAGTSCVGIKIDFLNEIIVANDNTILGAINAQAAAKEQNAINAKNQMLAGETPAEIITYLENFDCCNGGVAARQYGIVGFNDNGDLKTAAYTGNTNGNWGGHITGPNYSIQGNILDVELQAKILQGMEAGFLGSQGSLADKLMAALQGAKRVGADKRCGPDAESGDQPFNPDQYNSGRASFIRVRKPTDTQRQNNVGINNYLDISIGPVGQYVEPIDVLQCAFDTAMANTGFFCRDTVDTFPYTMDFENRIWEQEESCGVANAWIRSKFGTPSPNTGPTQANQGDMYTYFEATDLSGNNTGLGTTGYIASPCFVIAENKIATVTFDYHMWDDTANTMGTLSLEANDGGGSGWNTVWTKTGDQGNSWKTDGLASLIDYSGKTVKLRFKAAASNSYANDFALDNIQITTEDYCNTTATFNGTWNTNPDNLRATTEVMLDYNTLEGNIDACSLLVTNNATLTISAGTYVNIRSNVTVTPGSRIVIEHEGSLVQMLESATVINNGNIDVKLTTPGLIARDFMLLGSPMSGDTNIAFDGAYQVLKHTTENFNPYIPEQGDPAIVGVNFVDQEINDFTPHSGVLNSGEGYFVRPSYTEDGTYNYTFSQGTLNSGPITYNAFFGDDKQDSPSILANPYPSAIDATKFVKDNDVVSEVYYWNHLTTPGTGIPGPDVQNFNMEDVSMYNGTMGIQAGNGGPVPNGVIATGQGFGIKANNASGSDVVFNNSMRLTTGNDVLRSQEESSKDLLWITVNENEFQLGSTTGIGFLENGTIAFDEGYDSPRLGTVLGLYSHLETDNKALAIQAREAFNTEMEISLGFSSLIENDNHEYTITLSNLEGENIEAATVYLKDNVLNIITNLNEDSYTFNAAAGTQDNRFTILFNDEEEVLSTTDFSIDSINVSPNPTSNIITIASPKAAITNVQLYDLHGRAVINIVSRDDNQYVLDLSSLNTAIYYLNIVTGEGTFVKKVIKN